jgi:hypothetical protein
MSWQQPGYMERAEVLTALRGESRGLTEEPIDALFNKEG